MEYIINNSIIFTSISLLIWLFSLAFLTKRFEIKIMTDLKKATLYLARAIISSIMGAFFLLSIFDNLANDSINDYKNSEIILFLVILFFLSLAIYYMFTLFSYFLREVHYYIYHDVKCPKTNQHKTTKLYLIKASDNNTIVLSNEPIITSYSIILFKERSLLLEKNIYTENKNNLILTIKNIRKRLKRRNSN